MSIGRFWRDKITDGFSEEEDKQKATTGRVIQRSHSSLRSDKVNLRRRKALLIDPNNSNFNEFSNHFERIIAKRRENDLEQQCDLNTTGLQSSDGTTPPVSEDGNVQRNSMEAALDCLLNLDDVLDKVSSQSSDKEDDTGLVDETEIDRKRSQSLEDLMSVLTTDDQEKIHFLDNFRQILNHEEKHLVLLKTINKFKYILKESKVSEEILSSIFYNIGDLIDAQNNLVVCLQNMIDDWDMKKHLFTDIMDLYVLLHMHCKEYVKNITHATKELRSLFEKNEKFSEAMKIVVYEGSSLLLEVLIAKPTNWLCNSLENIKNIIEAAEGQCNLQMVKQTWKILKDNPEGRLNLQSNSMEKSAFLRSGMFIELLANDQRKLRHVFLFSGILICAKQKLQAEGGAAAKQHHQNNAEKTDANRKFCELRHIERLDTKWFILLQNLVIHPSKIVENYDKRKLEISNLKDKIRDLRMQLIAERAKLSECDTQASPMIKRSRSNNFSFRKMVIKKDVDKLQNQIMKTQSDLMLQSPTISFLVSNQTEKPHNLLVFSVKDFEIWKRAIYDAKKDIKNIDPAGTTLASVNSFLESYRTYSSINEVANAPLLRNINEEGISGVVVTTIESVDGLNPVYSYYLTIEVDSFGLNEVKARTKNCTNNTCLSWNESFDIDLDCSQTMTILLYQVKNYAQDKESLLGYFEFKLNLKELNNQTVIKTTPVFGEESTMLQIKVSFKIKTRNDLMKRQPSMMKTSLFGISLKSVVSRERSKSSPPVNNVPMIVYTCMKKIEEDGIDEEGIYRISGSKNDIQEFYRRLNKNASNALKDIGNYDLHTITGIVKLYFRELPEPLMLTENYNRFLEIANIGDDDERSKAYSDIIEQLPEPNHSTVTFILQHFQRVCEHSNNNHMVASNLGLIIGPTLMLPPCKNEKQDYTNFALETMNSMYLSRTFTQILNAVCNGTLCLNGAQCTE